MHTGIKVSFALRGDTNDTATNKYTALVSKELNAVVPAVDMSSKLRKILDKLNTVVYVCIPVISGNVNMKVAEKIEKKINRIKEGTTFKYQELNIDTDEYSAAAKAMERLIKKGTIKRVSTGVFYKPKQTAFGELLPREAELLRPYLFQGNKRIAYITGTALYNRMGLTTQVPKNVKVASREKRIITKVGNVQVKAVKSYVDVTNDNYYLLELLDALKDFKTIPDIDKSMAIKYLLNKVKELSQKDRTRLVKIALSYPPRVRAFLGALLSRLKENVNTDQLKKSLNPFTAYNFGLNKNLLPTAAKWHIK